MKHKGKKFDTSQWAAMFNQGLSTYEIAEQVGASNSYVSNVLKAHGVEVHKMALERLHAQKEATALERQALQADRAAKNREARAQKNQQIAEEKYRYWRQLWDEGKTMNEMAEILGRKPTVVPIQIRLLRLRYGWFPHRR